MKLNMQPTKTKTRAAIWSLLVLNMFDTLATQVSMGRGAVEMNPIVDFLIVNWGFGAVYGLKMALIIPLLFAVKTITESHLIYRSILFVLFIYVLLTVWHILVFNNLGII